MQMKTIIVFLITLHTTGFGRVGLGWVNNIVGWVGLGPVNWTHVHLCEKRKRYVTCGD